MVPRDFFLPNENQSIEMEKNDLSVQEGADKDNKANPSSPHDLTKSFMEATDSDQTEEVLSLKDGRMHLFPQTLTRRGFQLRGTVGGLSLFRRGA